MRCTCSGRKPRRVHFGLYVTLYVVGSVPGPVHKCHPMPSLLARPCIGVRGLQTAPSVYGLSVRLFPWRQQRRPRQLDSDPPRESAGPCVLMPEMSTTSSRGGLERTTSWERGAPRSDMCSELGGQLGYTKAGGARLSGKSWGHLRGEIGKGRFPRQIGTLACRPIDVRSSPLLVPWHYTPDNGTSAAPLTIGLRNVSRHHYKIMKIQYVAMHECSQ